MYLVIIYLYSIRWKQKSLTSPLVYSYHYCFFVFLSKIGGYSIWLFNIHKGFLYMTFKSTTSNTENIVFITRPNTSSLYHSCFFSYKFWATILNPVAFSECAFNFALIFGCYTIFHTERETLNLKTNNLNEHGHNSRSSLQNKRLFVYQLYQLYHM